MKKNILLLFMGLILVLFPINSCHSGCVKAPGLSLSQREVVSRQYTPPLRQLNRGSFHANPSRRNLWETALVGAQANSLDPTTLDYTEVAKTKQPTRPQCKKQQEPIVCCIAEMNFYAKAFGGANFLQSTVIDGNHTSYKTGYIAAGSVGYCWRCLLRAEIEYAYRRNGIEKIRFFGGDVANRGHFRTSSVMANLFWDLPLCSWGCSFWKLQPYLGAGAGYDFQKMHSSNSRIIFDQNWNHFSWQLMAGIFYPIFRNGELSLEYKFHQGGSQFNNHSIGIALAYKFGFIKKK